jgi:hypothetical protein
MKVRTNMNLKVKYENSMIKLFVLACVFVGLVQILFIKQLRIELVTTFKV